jgi:hypothetical protein
MAQDPRPEHDPEPRVASSRGRYLRDLGLALVVSAVAAVAVWLAVWRYTLSEAETRIEQVLLNNRGLHHYIQQVMHPEFYRAVASGQVQPSYYAPELLSSTFLVRNVQQFHNQERVASGQPAIYYKLAADNPRNPVNKADEAETELIERFNADRGLRSYREVVTVDGKRYLYYALPFLENTAACLRCHGDPDDAPPGLRACSSSTTSPRSSGSPSAAWRCSATR